MTLEDQSCVEEPSTRTNKRNGASPTGPGDNGSIGCAPLLTVGSNGAERYKKMRQNSIHHSPKQQSTDALSTSGFANVSIRPIKSPVPRWKARAPKRSEDGQFPCRQPYFDIHRPIWASWAITPRKWSIQLWAAMRQNGHERSRTISKEVIIQWWRWPWTSTGRTAGSNSVPEHNREINEVLC